jgi:hypothetical protein
MADAYTLLEEYIAAHSRDQEADPRQWLDRVPEGGERDKLAALIDAYLARAPMRQWDAAAFRDSGLAGFAEGVNQGFYSEAGAWPAVLPRLRERARLKRSVLVERLAAALGAQDKQAKVGSYYHGMEHGLLPSEGVSDKVLEALGSILGQSGEALRRAGRAVGTGRGGASAEAPAFARVASAKASADEPLVAGAPPSEGEWDEVDRLFRGG